jgi:hypothetical protein
VKSTLLMDTGPLVAILDADDQHHQASVEFASQVRDQLVTTWPVITEVSYLTGKARVAGRAGLPLDVLVAALARLEIAFHPLDEAFLTWAAKTAMTYYPRRIDLADLSLAWAGERLGCERIWTPDRRDFAMLRPSHATNFMIVP